MLTRILISVLIGIVVALLTSLLGTILIEFDIERIGNFLKSIAGVVGLIAGLYYFITGNNPVR